MNILLISKKYIFPCIVVLLSIGVLLNSIYELSPHPLYAQNEAVSLNDADIQVIYTENIDIKEEILNESISTSAKNAIYYSKVDDIKRYLSERNSPLAKYAEEFVKASDRYGIDYRLVASISIVESGGGKNCFRKYNAWGWGRSSFDSWKDGIWSVSAGIGKYYSKGLNTPKLISKYYCPPSASSWSKKVSFVMSEISN